MNANLLSKEQLLALGWKSRQIVAALDEPDDVGPAGHWLNRSGKPYYDRDRVALAAYRIGLTKIRPEVSVWKKWQVSDRPTSLPVLTFNFHALAEALHPGVSQRFSSLRISHPVMGRLPGRRETEKELIQEVLTLMVNRAFDSSFGDQKKLDQFLSERAAVASGVLGVPWPDGIVVRPALRRSYVSQAAATKSTKRFLDILSLVHTGLVQSPKRKRLDVIELLISAPRLRFDRIA